MKRVMGVLLGIGLLLLGWSSYRAADASEGRCGLVENQVEVLARGGAGRAFVALDDLGEAPFIDPASGETIVSLRSLFTIMADKGGVRWDESSRTALFQYEAHQFSIQLGPEGGVVNTRLDGTSYPLRAYLCDGHLHAPLRSVTDGLGLELRWYPSDRTAVIDPVWTTGVQPPAQAPATDPPKPQRPADCTAVGKVGWSDLLMGPLTAWSRVVKRTACALVI
jgi:hypothetical protein